MYEEEDEFSQTFIGVQIMLEVIREQIAELQKLNKALEGKVSRLEEEIDEREELSERKDEFISVLGHELRNPLGAIMYASELIDLKLDSIVSEPGEIKEDISVVLRQGQHLTRLVNDMLDMSRIIRGQFQIERKLIDLRDVIKNAVETCRPLIEGQRHVISLELSDVPPMIEGDPLRIEQTFVNILNNAAKYTPQGGHISLTMRESEHNALVSIKDSGVGIQKHLIEKMFDLFTRGRETGIDAGGLGIGLTVARGIVRLHNGDVWAESEDIGTGTTVHVRLPLAHVATRHEAPGGAKTIAPQKKRILVSMTM